jgi:hypothetical protein
MRILDAVPWLGRNAWKLAKAGAVVAVILELGGIWHELHHIRSEQVKNALYASPFERSDSFRRSKIGKRLESTAYVDGDVSIEGDVNLSEPVEVEIER